MKTTLRIVAYSTLVLALAFLAPLLGGDPSSPAIGFLLWGTAPLLAALLLRAATRDWSDIGLRPMFTKNIIWYAISFLAFPIAMALTVLTGTLTSSSSLSGFSWTEYLRTALTALVFFLVFAFVEEFGWRGYLTPKLASTNLNRYLGHVIVGVVWATWHLPFLTRLPWIEAPEDMATFIPRFFLACIAFSIVYGEIRIISGTLWPAALMHGTANAFGHPLDADYLSIAPGKEYLAAPGTGLITIAFLGLLAIAIHRRRQPATLADAAR